MDTSPDVVFELLNRKLQDERDHRALELLDHDGASAAAAVADGGDTALALLEGVDQMQRDPSPGGPQRVSKGDRPTVNVDFVVILKNKFNFFSPHANGNLIGLSSPVGLRE